MGPAKLAGHSKSAPQFAPVAQRIEHLTTDQKVGGSNPSGRAIYLMTGMSAPILVNSPTPPMVTCEVSCRGSRGIALVWSQDFLPAVVAGSGKER